MNKSNEPQEMSLAGAILFAWIAATGANFLWRVSEGTGGYILASIALWVGFGLLVLKILRILSEWVFEFKKYLRAIGDDETKGSAAWLTEKEARQSGLHKMAAGTRFMGVLGRTALWMKTETHSLVIGPAGSQKSTSVILNQLMRMEESCLVNDTKGEFFEQTAEHRKQKLGHDIVKLDPTDENSDCINLLDFIHELIMQNSPEALTFTSGMALQLYPEPPKEGANRFFRDGTRQEIETVALSVTVVCPIELRNLATVYRAFTDENFLHELLLEAGKCSLLSGAIANRADDLHRMVFGDDGSARTHEQFRIGAMQALKEYGPGNYLAPITSKTTFSIADLKTRKITVYLIIDFANKDVLGKWAGLMQWYAAYMLVRVRNNVPVYFILDEFCNSPLHGLPTILTLLRSYGILVVMATQDLDDIVRVYGKNALETILSETDIKQFLSGIRSKTTLDYLSKYLGDFSEIATNFAFGDDGLKESTSRINRPLSSSDELRRLTKGYQIIIYSNMKPILARAIQVFSIAPWRLEIAPNSMYGGKRYLLPVEVTIKGNKSTVATRGRSIEIKKSIFWPIVKYVFRSFSGSFRATALAISIFFIMFAGFPHLRAEYTYSGSLANPTRYYWCEYWGPTPFIITNGDCPLIKFRRIW